MCMCISSCTAESGGRVGEVAATLLMKCRKDRSNLLVYECMLVDAVYTDGKQCRAGHKCPQKHLLPGTFKIAAHLHEKAPSAQIPARKPSVTRICPAATPQWGERLLCCEL
jgi:hypothetical protein